MKERLDNLLVEKELVKTRSRAKNCIEAGMVSVNGKIVKKAGEQVDDTADIKVNDESLMFVSRGGFKLFKAIKFFEINLSGKVCLDIGASTGGFTDCMLKEGADFVYALDVGTAQLAEELRKSGKVLSIENTNAKDMKKEMFDKPVEFASADVSFISLEKIFPYVFDVLAYGARAVFLVKPQFEAGKGNIGKKGVVKDKKIHERVIGNVCSSAVSTGFKVLGLTFSPVKGPEGNIEYLLYVEKNSSDNTPAYTLPLDIKTVVERAHSELS